MDIISSEAHTQPSPNGYLKPDPEHIREFLTTAKRGRDRVAIRVPNNPDPDQFFEGIDQAVNYAARENSRRYQPYFLLNPTQKQADNVADADISRFFWLPLDFDPVRDADTQTAPSTDAEKEAAHRTMLDCRDYLRGYGFLDPIVGDSGNGYHLLYAIDLPNNPATRDLIKSCIEAVAYLFGDDRVKVDTSVANPGRIWKLYGTVAHKGTASPERPHRLSRVLDMPESPKPLSRLKLEALAEKAPKSEPVPERAQSAFNGPTYDVQGLLDRAGVDVKKKLSLPDGGTKWELAACPWNGHDDHAGYIYQYDDGPIRAGCGHNSCEDYGWNYPQGNSMRELYEAAIPGSRDSLYDPTGTGTGTDTNVPSIVGSNLKCVLEARTFDEIGDPPPAEFLVKKLIPAGFPTIMYGMGGEGKSWLALYLSMWVAAAQDYWIGHAIESPCPVLYLDFELDAETQSRRAHRLMRGMGLESPPENLKYMSALGFSTAEAFEKVYQLCAQHSIGLVVMDSVGNALEGDSEASKDVLTFMRDHVETLTVNGVATVLIDHIAKMLKGENRRNKLPFGSVYKFNSARSVIQLEGDWNDDARKLVTTLRHVKSNFGPLAGEFAASIDFDDEATKNVTITPVNAKDAIKVKTLTTEDKVISGLELHGPMTPKGISSVVGDGVKLKTIQNAVGDLVKENRLEYTGETKDNAKVVQINPNWHEGNTQC
jgi:AAA domain